jgi:hypothetical protein
MDSADLGWRMQLGLWWSGPDTFCSIFL